MYLRKARVVAAALALLCLSRRSLTLKTQRVAS